MVAITSTHSSSVSSLNFIPLALSQRFIRLRFVSSCSLGSAGARLYVSFLFIAYRFIEQSTEEVSDRLFGFNFRFFLRRCFRLLLLRLLCHSRSFLKDVLFGSDSRFVFGCSRLLLLNLTPLASLIHNRCHAGVKSNIRAASEVNDGGEFAFVLAIISGVPNLFTDLKAVLLGLGDFVTVPITACIVRLGFLRFGQIISRLVFYSVKEVRVCAIGLYPLIIAISVCTFHFGCFHSIHDATHFKVIAIPIAVLVSVASASMHRVKSDVDMQFASVLQRQCNSYVTSGGSEVCSYSSAFLDTLASEGSCRARNLDVKTKVINQLLGEFRCVCHGFLLGCEHIAVTLVEFRVICLGFIVAEQGQLIVYLIERVVYFFSCSVEGCCIF